MNADELKQLIDQWQQAMRRCIYLQALRDALPAGAAAAALDAQIAEAAAQAQRLKRLALDAQG